MGEAVAEVGDFVDPPMASYRWTMSEMDVRRICERGLGSSGGTIGSAGFEGKISIDCGRGERPDAEMGVVGADDLLVRGEPGWGRPEFGGDRAEPALEGGWAVETDANPVERRLALLSATVGCCWAAGIPDPKTAFRGVKSSSKLGDTRSFSFGVGSASPPAPPYKSTKS
jgi:hypothetical protein